MGRESRQHGQHCGIETLQVSRLQDARFLRPPGASGHRPPPGLPPAASPPADPVPASSICGGHGVMLHRGNGHLRRIEPRSAASSSSTDEKTGMCIWPAASAARSAVRLDSSSQRHAQPRRLKLAIDTKMVTAERTRPGNRNAHIGIAGYLMPLCPPPPSGSDCRAQAIASHVPRAWSACAAEAC